MMTRFKISKSPCTEDEDWTPEKSSDCEEEDELENESGSDLGDDSRELIDDVESEGVVSSADHNVFTGERGLELWNAAFGMADATTRRVLIWMQNSLASGTNLSLSRAVMFSFGDHRDFKSDSDANEVVSKFVSASYRDTLAMPLARIHASGIDYDAYLRDRWNDIRKGLRRIDPVLASWVPTNAKEPYEKILRRIDTFYQVAFGVSIDNSRYNTVAHRLLCVALLCGHRTQKQDGKEVNNANTVERSALLFPRSMFQDRNACRVIVELANRWADSQPDLRGALKSVICAIQQSFCSDFQQDKSVDSNGLARIDEEIIPDNDEDDEENKESSSQYSQLSVECPSTTKNAISSQSEQHVQRPAVGSGTGGGEGVLHENAKLVVAQRTAWCRAKVSCCVCGVKQDARLLPDSGRVAVEKSFRVENSIIRPDVSTTQNDGQPYVAIEICNTHKTLAAARRLRYDVFKHGMIELHAEEVMRVVQGKVAFEHTILSFQVFFFSKSNIHIAWCIHFFAMQATPDSRWVCEKCIPKKYASLKQEALRTRWLFYRLQSIDPSTGMEVAACDDNCVCCSPEALRYLLMAGRMPANASFRQTEVDAFNLDAQKPFRFNIDVRLFFF